MKDFNEQKKYLKRVLKRKMPVTEGLSVSFMIAGFFGLSLDLEAAWVYKQAFADGDDHQKMALLDGKDKAGDGSIILTTKDRVNKTLVNSVVIGLGGNDPGRSGTLETQKLGIDVEDYSSGNNFNSGIVAIGSVRVQSNPHGVGRTGTGGQAVAIGNDVTSTSQAVAIGNNTYALGGSSIAIGNDDITTYRDKITTYDYNNYLKPLYDKIDPGRSTYGIGDAENAIYSPNVAAGEGSISIGSRSMAYKPGSTALGTLAYALGQGTTALGTLSRAEGEESIAIGGKARVFADHAIGAGNRIQILKEGGAAFGYKAYSAGEGAIAIGTNVYSNAFMNLNQSYQGAVPGQPNVNFGRVHDIMRKVDLKANAKGTLTNGATENYEITHNSGEVAGGLYFSNRDHYLDALEELITSKNSSDKLIALSPITKELNGVKNVVQQFNPNLISPTKENRPAKNGIVIGTNSIAGGGNSIAMGRGAFAMNDNTFALGSYSYADENNALAIGLATRALGKNSLALGVGAGVGGRKTLVDGVTVEKKGMNSSAIGTGAVVQGDNSILFGAESVIDGDRTSLIGIGSEVSGNSNLVFGSKAMVLNHTPTPNGAEASRLNKSRNKNFAGNDSELGTNYNNIAIGNETIVTDRVIKSIAIGTGARIFNDTTDNSVVSNSAAFGVQATVKQNFALGPKHTGNSAMAIGNFATASLENSVALGVNSKTDYTYDDLNKPGWVAKGAIAVPTSGKVGVISVGSVNNERRIVNLASGYLNTDAVNVAQLKTLEEKMERVHGQSEGGGFRYLAVDSKVYRNNQTMDGELLAVYDKDHTGDSGKVAYIIEKEDNFKNYVEARYNQLMLKARESYNGDTVTLDSKNEINAQVEKYRKLLKADGILNKTDLSKADAEIFGRITGVSEDNYKAAMDRINALKEKAKETASRDGFDTSGNRVKLDANGNLTTTKVDDKDRLITTAEIKEINDSNIYNNLALGNDSIAFGYKAKATERALKGIAIGHTAFSSGTSAIAIGSASKATANYAVAVGNGAEATGVRAIAIGNGTKASHDTLAVGVGIDLSGKGHEEAIAIGTNTDKDGLYGQYSTSVGISTKTGKLATAIGHRTKAEGENAVALGYQADANAKNSTAIGKGATASVENSVALGQGSTTTAPSGNSYLTNVAAVPANGVVAVGNRRIQNVADGAADQDAVTVKQLKEVNLKFAADTVGTAITRKTGETLGIKGTTNQITTSVNGNDIKIGLAKDVTDKLAKINTGSVSNGDKNYVIGGDVYTAITGAKPTITGSNGINVTTTAGTGTKGDTHVISLDETKVKQLAGTTNFGSVTGTGITVTGAGKTVGGGLTLAITDGAITTAKIADKNVTEAKLADDLKNKIASIDSKANASDLTNLAKKDLSNVDNTTFNNKITKGNLTSTDLQVTGGTNATLTNVTVDLKQDTKAKIAKIDNKADKSDLGDYAKKDGSDIASGTITSTTLKVDGTGKALAGNLTIDLNDDTKAKIADIANKANKNDVYTKTETDTELAKKANTSDLANKANVSDLASYVKVDGSNVNNTNRSGLVGALSKDADLSNPVGALVTDTMLKPALAAKADKTDLNSYAKKDGSDIASGNITSTTLTVTGNGKLLKDNLSIELKDKSITDEKLSNDLKGKIDSITNKADASDLTNKADINLGNIDTAGKDVIKGLVKVEGIDGITVDKTPDGSADKYTVKLDTTYKGKLDNLAANPNATYATKTELGAKADTTALDAYAKKDASNLDTNDKAAWKTALGVSNLDLSYTDGTNNKTTTLSNGLKFSSDDLTISTAAGNGDVKFSLKDDTIDSAKLKADSVITDKIADKNVTKAKLADDLQASINSIASKADTTYVDSKINNIGSTAKLKYKAANESTPNETTLDNGLHFKSGDANLTVSTSTGGVVTYTLAKDLTGINSIEVTTTNKDNDKSAVNVKFLNEKIAAVQAGSTTALDAYAKLDASNLTNGNVNSWVEKLGSGATLNTNPTGNGKLATEKAVKSYVDDRKITFKGNNNTVAVDVPLDNTLNIIGEGTAPTNTASDNIKVTGGAAGKTLTVGLAKELKNITSIAGGTNNKSKVSLADNGITLGNDGANVVVAKDGTNTTAKITGLTDRKIEDTGYGEAGRAATETAVKDLATKLGLDGNNGGNGTAGGTTTGPAGKDGLDGKSIVDKVDALRDGLAGTVVYTDPATGERLVKGKDGKYYKKADLNTDGTAIAGKQPVDNPTLSLVSGKDGNTTTPVTLGNLVSGLGLDKNKTDGSSYAKPITGADAKNVISNLLTNGTDIDLNKAATVRDLQALAQAGLDFGANVGTDIHKALGQKLEIIGKSGVTAFTDYSTDNIATNVNNGKIEIGMLKTPKFDSVKLKDITLTPSDDGSKLTLSNEKNPTATDKKVVLDGLKDGSTPDSAVTKKTIDDLKTQLGLNGTNGNNGNNGGTTTGPAGKDGLDGKSIVDKVDALRKGEAGPVVYTDKDGNRLVVGKDGKYYSADDIKDKTYIDGKGYFNSTDVEDDPAGSGNKVVKTGLNEADVKIAEKTPVRHSLVNATDGSTTNASVLGNVADGKIAANSKEAINGSQLKDVLDKAGIKTDSNGNIVDPTITKVKDEKGNDPTNAKTNVVDGLNDVIATVNKGLVFAGDEGSATQNLGSTVNIKTENAITTGIGANAVKYVGDNLTTKYEKDTTTGTGILTIAMKESPTFKEVKATDKFTVGDDKVVIKPGDANANPATGPSIDFAKNGNDGTGTITGLKTPDGTDKTAAANVDYVDNKITNATSTAAGNTILNLVSGSTEKALKLQDDKLKVTGKDGIAITLKEDAADSKIKEFEVGLDSTYKGKLDKIAIVKDGKDGQAGTNGSNGTGAAGNHGATGKDGLNGKDLTEKVNALRNGEAGTVVYTDPKTGERLVKGNDGKYYRPDQLKEDGTVKDDADLTNKPAVENPVLSLVNGKDGETTTPISLGNLANGLNGVTNSTDKTPITAEKAKKAIQGVANDTNNPGLLTQTTGLDKAATVGDLQAVAQAGLDFTANYGTNAAGTGDEDNNKKTSHRTLGQEIKILGEGTLAANAKTAADNIKVVSDGAGTLTVKLTRNLTNIEKIGLVNPDDDSKAGSITIDENGNVVIKDNKNGTPSAIVTEHTVKGQKISYKVNDGKAEDGITVVPANSKQVTLETGFNFVNGDNTTATIDDNGKVKYSLNKALTEMNSVAGGTDNKAKVVFNNANIKIGYDSNLVTIDNETGKTGARVAGLEARNIASENYGKDKSRAATEGAVQDIAEKLGLIANNGTPGVPGTNGKDGLDGKSVIDKVDALRDGTAGPVVYTDKDGNRLVVGKDNKFYKASDLVGKEYVDGKGYYDSANVENDPAGSGKKVLKNGIQEDTKLTNVENTNVRHSLVNADGTTINASVLGNVADGKIATNSKEAINGSQLKDVLDKAGIKIDDTTGKVKDPEITKVKDEKGNDQTGKTNVVDGLNDVIATVNKGMKFGADQGTAATQQLGSQLDVKATTDTLTKSTTTGSTTTTENFVGKNLVTSYKKDATTGNGTITIGMSETPEFKTITINNGTGGTTTIGVKDDGTPTVGGKDIATKDDLNSAAGSTTLNIENGLKSTEKAAINLKDDTLKFKGESGVDVTVDGTNKVVKIALNGDYKGKLDKLANVSDGRDGKAGENGSAGTAGTAGSKGATGKDGLNGKDLTEKVNALRNGEAGTVVYTDPKTGERLVKGNNGKYYRPDQLKEDGTVKDDADLTNKPAVENPVLSLVNGKDGETTTPISLGNLANGLNGVTNSTDDTAIGEDAAKKAINGEPANGSTPAKPGLLTQTTGLDKAATVGDLQVLAQAGLDFAGNDTTVVHRALGTKLLIKGAGTDATINALTVAEDNIKITGNSTDNKLTVGLSKNLKNIEDITFKGANGKDGKIGVDGAGNIIITNGIDGKNGETTSKVVTVDTVGDQTLTYRANNVADGTLTADNKVKLSKGLNFTSGNTNLTVATEADGKVTYTMANALTGINSISGGTTNKSKVEFADTEIKLTNDDKSLIVKKDTNGMSVTGLEDRTMDTSGYGVADRAATEGALKNLAGKLGLDGNNGTSGTNGKDGVNGGDGKDNPSGKDGLNGKSIVEKVDALRDGTAGPVVYTDKDGNRLVAGKDGNYYKATDIAGKTYVKGKGYFDPSKVEADGTLKTGVADTEKVASTTPVKHSLVNAETGETKDSLSKLGNVASGLGLDDKVGGAVPTLDVAKAKEIVAGTDGASGLLTQTTGLDNVANVKDLKALALAGLDFAGNDTTVVHRALGTKLSVIGELSAGKTITDTAKDNITVAGDTNGSLTIKLAKDLKNIDSITSKPDDKGNTSTITLNGKDGIGINGKDGGTLTVYGKDGKDGVSIKGSDGTNGSTISIYGKDGKDGKNAEISVNNDGNLVVTNGKDGKNGIDGTTSKIVTEATIGDQSLTYRANSIDDTKLTDDNKVSLKKGLDFTSGNDNITVATAKDGKITYTLANALTGINSISGGTTNKSKVEFADTEIKLTNDDKSLIVKKDTNGMSVTGLEARNLATTGYGIADRAATEAAVKDLASKLGLDGSAGKDADNPKNSGNTPGGKDGLNDKPFNEKIDALRGGEAGPVVYTLADGTRVVTGKDGKIYKADEIKDKVYVENTADPNKQGYYDSSVVEKDASGKNVVKADQVATAQPVNNVDTSTNKVVHSLVNKEDGETTSPSVLTNVASALGLDSKPTTPAAITADNAKTAIETLLTKSDDKDLNKAATARDLQAVAQAGLDFDGNNVGTSTIIHRALGQKLSIVGEETDVATGSTNKFDSARGNIQVVADGTDKLTVKLTKDLKNIDSITSKPDNKGNTSTITLNGKDGIGINGTDGGTLVVKGKDGKDGVSIKGSDGTNGSTISIYGKDGKDGKDGKSAELSIDKDGNLVVTNGKDGKDGTNGVTSKVVTEKTLTDGLLGNMVYTDKDGTKLVKGDDGKYHPLQADGTPDLTKEVKPEDIIISTVNPDGKTTTPTSIGNVASALGLDGKDAVGNVFAKPIEKDQAQEVVKNLLTKSEDTDLNKVATARDLQAIAQAGLDFEGNTGINGTVVHRALGTKVLIIGDGTNDNTGFESASGNIQVKSDKDTNTLTIALGKDLKNINSISSEPKDGKTTTITLDGKDGMTVKPGDGTTTTNIGKDGITIKPTDANDKSSTFIGKDGVGIKGKDGKDGITINGANGTDGKDGGSIVVHGKDGADGVTIKGTDGKDGKDGASVVVKGADGKDGVAISGKDGGTIEVGKADNGKAAVVINGKDGKDGSIGIKGADGTDAISINGKDGSIVFAKDNDGKETGSITGLKDPERKTDGTLKDPTSAANSGFVDKTVNDAIDKLTDKGMTFAGNDGDNVARKLGETLTIKGKGTVNGSTAANNIKVTGDKDDGSLTIGLAEKLTNMISFETKDLNDGKDGNPVVKEKVKLDKDGLTTTKVDGNVTNTTVTGPTGTTVTETKVDNTDPANPKTETKTAEYTVDGSKLTGTDGKSAEYTTDKAEVKGKDGTTTMTDGGLKVVSNDPTTDKSSTTIAKDGMTITGKDGKDGITINGANGTDGKDGGSITVHGANGADGVTITGKDGANGGSVLVKTDDGKDGVAISGKDGGTIEVGKDDNGKAAVVINGKDGKDGSIGIKGSDGKDAITLNGKDGTITTDKVTVDGKNGTVTVDGITINGKDGAITGIKDLDDDADGTSVVNKNYVDNKVAGLDEKLDAVDKNRPFEYYDNDGNKVTRGRDGKLYKDNDIKDKVYVDGKGYFDKNDVEKDTTTGKNIVKAGKEDTAETHIKPSEVVIKAMPLTTKDATGKDVDTNMKVTNVAKGDISDKSTDAINGSQLDSVAKALGLKTENGLAKVPKFVDIKAPDSKDITTPSNYKGAIDETIKTVNKGIAFGSDKVAADTTKPQYMGSKFEVKALADGEVLTKAGITNTNFVGKNVVTNYTKDTDGNGRLDIAISERPVFKEVTATEKITIGKNGNTTVIDGSTITAGTGDSSVVINGKDGAIGVNGKDGGTITVNGKDGKDGVSIKGSDGTNGSSIAVNGKDGKDGVTINGTDGKDGSSIVVNGKDGTNGVSIKGDNGKDGATVNIGDNAVVINGKDGKDGSIGIKGADGKDGISLNGKDGAIGVNGADGKPSIAINGKDGSIGIKGVDGKDGISLNGKDGTIGVNGKDGGTIIVNGKDGKDGVTINGKDGTITFAKDDKGNGTGSITGLKEPERNPDGTLKDPTSAATTGSVDRVNERVDVIQNQNQELAKAVNSNSKRIEEVDKRSREGIAAVAAMAVLDFNDAPVGRVGVGAAVGGYRGTQAVSVGAVYGINESFKVNAKVGIPTSNTRSTTYGVSATYYFDR